LKHDLTKVREFYAGFEERAVIGIEASSKAAWFEEMLASLGHKLFVGNPVLIRKRATSRHKSDRRDAELILELLLRGEFPAIWRRPAESTEVIEIMGLRQSLVRQRTQLINAIRGHLAEYGWVAPRGMAHVAMLADLLDVEEMASTLPEAARPMFAIMVDMLAELDKRIATLDHEIAKRAREDEAARRLMTIPGIGPITATAIIALAPPVETFRKGRDFAAWLGLTPRQHSTGGKQRLGSISKMGERTIRRLLIIGGSSVVRQACLRGAPTGSWLEQMLARKPRMLVSVALANKMARTVWALLTRHEDYKAPAAVAA